MPRLAFFVALFFILTPYVAEASPIQNATNRNRRLQPSEIVLVLDSTRPNHGGDTGIAEGDYERLIDKIRALPDSILMGEDAARMAVITFSLHPMLEVGLTSEERLIRLLTDHRRQANGLMTVRQTHEALGDVKDVLLRNGRKRAAKIVILITAGEPNVMAGQGTRDDIRPTEQAARELSDLAAKIYVLAYVSEMTSDLRAHLSRVTGGDPRRVFDCENSARLTDVFNMMIEVIERDLGEGAVDDTLVASNKSDASAFGNGTGVGFVVGILLAAAIVGFGWIALRWKKRRDATNGHHGDSGQSDGASVNVQYAVKSEKLTTNKAMFD